MSDSSKQIKRQHIRDAIAHFEHILPSQAAIKDFVHHNTLHGFEHLVFPEALDSAYKTLGAYGYLSNDEFRQLYRQGRITETDLQQVLNETTVLKSNELVFKIEDREIDRQAIYIANLLYSMDPINTYQLNWNIEESHMLSKIQEDIPKVQRKQFLRAAREHGIDNEADAVEDLWNASLHVLNLDHYILHPEEMMDLTPEQAEHMLSDLIPDEINSEGQPIMDGLIEEAAKQQINQLFSQLGGKLTLNSLLKTLTGEDLLDEMQPLLIRYLSSFLDQGYAAWHDPDREIGFYAMWRSSAERDLAWIFEDLPDWLDSLEALPKNAFDTVIIELMWLGLDEDKWEGYLESIALELPGWSGMFLWRHQRPGYDGLQQVKVEMVDYLAVRLVLERLFAQRLCRNLWQIEASFDVIKWYLKRNLPEFIVRNSFYNNNLPEYIISLSQRQLTSSDAFTRNEEQWWHLAHLIWTWQHSSGAEKSEVYTVCKSAWPLFRMTQHLGLCGQQLRSLNIAQVEMIFDCIETIDEQHPGFLWLQAYEYNYRDKFLHAINANHGRGRWQQRKTRAQAQWVFCMDDREESTRRHLEENNPNIETLGAAGFFGVPINWRGLDDKEVSLLCPVVVIPSHEIRETARDDQVKAFKKHKIRRNRRLQLRDILYQETRRNLLLSSVLIMLSAPLALLSLLTKSYMPLSVGRLIKKLRESYDTVLATTISITTEHPEQEASPEHPRVGFTDQEQADKVQGFLRSIGLQQGFAPFVVMVGHGSGSQNNPHLAAYDCGACSGRHGGPNARVFAAMANRPEIRQILRERGLDIPADTWMLGAEHNTCDEDITWYDTDAIPDAMQEAFQTLRQDLYEATLSSSHERCRRLASAPKNPSLKKAFNHLVGRAYDYSQARPELGHATNAAAIIGRRSISQGVFFDRRVFLISYDPTQDLSGDVLETILLAAAPVGAGINLEYYFSTVNNEQFGCGSKITHNITGLLGVMHGTSDDLRTGLPKQMIEIHEAMRLQVLVEASIDVLTKIYQRQPLLQQLIGNGWLLLNAKDPITGSITNFKPEQGFIEWVSKDKTPLPEVDCSMDWYAGKSLPLSPVLIKQPEAGTY